LEFPTSYLETINDNTKTFNFYLDSWANEGSSNQFNIKTFSIQLTTLGNLRNLNINSILTELNYELTTTYSLPIVFYRKIDNLIGIRCYNTFENARSYIEVSDPISGGYESQLNIYTGDLTNKFKIFKTPLALLLGFRTFDTFLIPSNHRFYNDLAFNISYDSYFFMTIKNIHFQSNATEFNVSFKILNPFCGEVSRYNYITIKEKNTLIQSISSSHNSPPINKLQVYFYDRFGNNIFYEKVPIDVSFSLTVE
jgi:hypothetical protein